MDDDVAPSRYKAIRWPTLGVDPFGVRRIIASVGLILAALLTDGDPPEPPWWRVPVIAEGFAAWSVGFIVMAVAAAIVAARHDLGRVSDAGAILVAIGALLLIPVVHGTGVYLNHDLSDINYGFFYQLPSPLPIIFTVVGIAVSRFVSGLRLLVLISASVVGAFTVSGLWERRIFDDLNVAVMIVSWVAVISVVIVITLWTPDDRWSDEARVQGPRLPTFLPQPRTDGDVPR